MKNVNYMSKLADIYRFKCIFVLVVALISAPLIRAEKDAQPLLPWEEEFVSLWGLNSDIAWMAEDISEFDVNYDDGVRAGIWGLSAATARFYGLTVNDKTDERFDINKATSALVRYMYHLIAINRGDTLAAITMYVNSSFVAEGDTAFKRPKNSAKYIDAAVLDNLNAAYRRSEVKQTSTCQPKPAVEEPAVAPEQPATTPSEVIYIVRKGENLSQIARAFGVNVSDIQKWNNIKGSVIFPDQQLKIYVNK